AHAAWVGLFFVIGAGSVEAQPLAAGSEQAAASSDSQQSASLLRVKGDVRSSTLTAMYGTFVALQGLDLLSTSAARSHGGIESNPWRALSTEPAYLIALKGVGVFGVTFTAEKLRKKHRITALVMMVGLNIGYSVIVAHNLSVAVGH